MTATKDTVAALKKELKKGEELFPVFLLAGEDLDSMEIAINSIETAINPQEKIVLSGFEHPIEKILEHTQSSSMFSMGGIELLLVRHAEGYQGRKSQSTPFAPSDEELSRIESYLKSPSTDKVLLFIFNAEAPKAKKRGKDFFSMVSKHAKTYIFNPPKTMREAYSKAVQMFKSYGLNADHHIINALVEECGTDTSQMRHSIEKIFLFMGAQSGITVTEHALEQVVIHTKLSTIYALQDSFAYGNLDRALSALRDILSTKEFDAVRVLVYLQFRIREIYAVSQKLQKGMSRRQIMASAGRQAWRIERVLKQAERCPTSVWEEIITLLYETDVRIKSSPIPAVAIIEDTIIKGCELISKNQQR